MPGITPNLNLNRPFSGEAVGLWDTLVNPNWDIIDALFSGVPSTSPGGTGHVHNGLPGQGPQISHTYLTNAGSKTHDQIETEITNISNRVTAIESNYCADSTCGAGQGGTGADPQPPLHYTDNFTTPQGTRLAQNDWLVSSDSTIADFQTSGHSAFLSHRMPLKCVDRYAAVVKCQIPHSTAQRVTYHVSRFTADGLEDADGIMMVMALMSTHLLGSASPFIHYCGIKFVLALTRTGGAYTVARLIVAEPNDGVFTVLKQDVFTGLTFNAAEIHFRGCHEFSMDENGGVWYYHNRAPVYILPSGSVTPYIAGLQLTLGSLAEPPFGSIGFGWAWDRAPLSSMEIEMDWLTIDSKSNIEDLYTTSYTDPGNEPAPFDPTPGELCCGGIGPQIGTLVDLGDGLQIKAVACVTDPWNGVLLENGQVMPCGDYAAPTGGDPGPEGVTEGSTFTREIPIVNMTPPANTDYVIAGEEAFDYVHVEINSMGATITGRVKDGAYGLPDPTIMFVQKTKPANIYGPVTICLLEAGSLGIVSIETIDPVSGVPGPSLPEGDYWWIKITTTGFTSSGPFPVALGGDLAIVGSIGAVDQKYLMADNDLRARVIANDLQPPYDPSLQKIDVTVTRGASIAADSKQVIETEPIITGIWVTADSGGGPPYSLAPGSTITFDVYGKHFDDDGGVGHSYLVLPPGSPHVIVAQPTYVNPGQLQGAQITLGGVVGTTLDLSVTNPGGVSSGPPQVVLVVADLGPFPVIVPVMKIGGVDVAAPIEGQWLHVELPGLPPRPGPPIYDLEVSIGGGPLPTYSPYIRNFSVVNAGLTDTASFDFYVPKGVVGSMLALSLARYQAAFQLLPNLGLIQAEPIPAGTPTACPLYPGATGSTTISGVGPVFMPGLRVYGNPPTYVTVNSVTPIGLDKIAVDYTISTAATIGAAISFNIENIEGASAVIPLGDVTSPPVIIDSIDVSPCENVEGRKNVPFVARGKNFKNTATISIVAGPGTVHDVVWISSTEMRFQADFPIAPAGGNPYTVQISNPAPDPSSASQTLTLGVEPIPRVGIVLQPATTGVGRTIQLVGQNIYCIDDVCPSDSIFSFTNLANVVWTRKSNLMWEGTCDITGLGGQTVVADVSTPGGQSYSGIASALIRNASITPTPAVFTPGGVETATQVSFRIDGLGFDSVAVLKAKTTALVPIGESQTTNMQITAMSTDWIVGKITLPNGVADAVYEVEFYDVTLALIGTMAAAFTAVKGALSPYITNKATPFSTTPGATVTATFTLDPATPITNPAAWSVIGGTLISATDMSGGAGLTWEVKWTNGVAGPLEIRVSAPVTPVTYDSIRRTIS